MPQEVYVNPQTGERIVYNEKTGTWDPVGSPSPSPPPAVPSTGPPLLQAPGASPPAKTTGVFEPFTPQEEQALGSFGKFALPTLAGLAAGAPAAGIAARMGAAGLRARPAFIQTLLEGTGAAATAPLVGTQPGAEFAGQVGGGVAGRAIGGGLGLARRGASRLLAGKVTPEAVEKLRVAREAGVHLTGPEATGAELPLLFQQAGEAGFIGQTIRRVTRRRGSARAKEYAEEELTKGFHPGAPSGVVGRTSRGTPSQVAGTIHKARETGAALGRQQERALWGAIENQELDLRPLLQRDPDLAAQLVALKDPAVAEAAQGMPASIQAQLFDPVLQSIPLGMANSVRSPLLGKGRLLPSQGGRTAPQGLSQHQANILTDTMEDAANQAGIGAEFRQARDASTEFHDIYTRTGRIGKEIRKLEETPEKIVQMLKPGEDLRAIRLKQTLLRYVRPGTTEAAQAAAAWDNVGYQFLRDKLAKGVGPEINLAKLTRVSEELDSYGEDMLKVIASTPQLGKLVVDPKKWQAIQNVRTIGRVLASRTKEMNIRTSILTGDIRASLRILYGAGTAYGGITGGPLGAAVPELGTAAISVIVHSPWFTQKLVEGLKAPTREAAQKSFTLLVRELPTALRAYQASTLVTQLDEAERTGDQVKAANLRAQLTALYRAETGQELGGGR